MSDLIAAIEEKLLGRPFLKQVSSKLFPTIAIVEEYDEELEEARISYTHPVDQSIATSGNVKINSERGAAPPYLEKGDSVMIIFPHGEVVDPVIVAIYPREQSSVLGGSYVP